MIMPKLFKRKRNKTEQPTTMVCKPYPNGHCAVVPPATPSVQLLTKRPATKDIEETHIKCIQRQLDSLLTICPIGQQISCGDARLDVFDDRIQYTNTRTHTVYLSIIFMTKDGTHHYFHTTDLGNTDHISFEDILQDHCDLTQLVALRIGAEYVKTL